MSAFDPYHVWLGIPPSEQPPNHYRLLALAPFEASPEVIENAAERQMAHVRRAAHGKHGDESQRILNEISAAQRALLDGARKARYDAELREKLSPPARAVAQTIEYTPAIPAAPPPPRTAPPLAPAGAPPTKWKQSPKAAPPIAEPASPLPFASLASPSVASHAPSPLRARAKQKIPVLLVAVLAIVAILPVLALVVAFGLSAGDASVATSDDERESSTATPDTARPNQETRPAPTTVVNNNERPLPRPGEGSSGTPTPVAHTNTDNRDPFDNSASFGRTSGKPKLEQTLTISASTLLPRLAFFSLPGEARTPIEVKAGQIVKLKIDGQWRIAATEPRGIDALYIAVGHAGQPATQFAQGAREVEFNVQKDGWLFMGIEDLLNFDNTGEMTVQVSVY